MAKASSNDILGLGSLWDRNRGHPSVLKHHKTSQGASRSMAKASSNDILGLGKPLRSGTGGHPSVLKSHKTREGASRSMAKASSNDLLEAFGIGAGAVRQF